MTNSKAEFDHTLPNCGDDSDIDLEYSGRLFSALSMRIRTDEVAQEKGRELSNDTRVQQLVGQQVRSSANTYHQFDLDKLLKWWFWRAEQVGIETANQDLDDYLNNDKVGFILTLWIRGLNGDDVVELTDTIRLTPMKDMPDSDDKDRFIKSPPSGGSYFGFAPTMALTIEKDVTKLSGYPSDNVNEANSLSEVALLLNILPHVNCVGMYETAYPKNHVPYGPMGGGGGGLPRIDVLPKNNSGTVDLSLFHGLWEKFQALDQKWKERILRSCGRLQQAKARQDIHDKALDLGIALEMVLLGPEHKGDELPGQLSNHFRTRGAWLLGIDRETRINVYNSLRDIYSRRSQVAHNGFLKTKKGQSIEDIRPDIDNDINIVEAILRKLIEGSPPTEWTDIIFGE